MPASWLCYNCDEKFGRGHNRVCQQLFLLDGVAEEDVEDTLTTEAPRVEQDMPHIFLNAIAGIHFSDTMQIVVKLGGSVLTALLDSGSTHNFIVEAAAHRSGLPIQHRPHFMATVANGERVSCPGVLRQAPFVIGDDLFHADLFVMPLAGYDLVLGTQWLATLGPVL